MSDLVVYPAERPLSGSVPVASDKSITHRALLLGALARGTSRVEGGVGADNAATIAALRSLGIEVDVGEGGVRIEGRGLGGLSAPARDLDCGNSGTTARLLAGVLAAQRFTSVLVGDESLTRRPMERVAKPLRLRGARIEGRLAPDRPGESFLPMTIGPLPAPHVLGALEYELPVPSAQVKSALLLSGLFADGPTFVREPTVSRDHTERMLLALGVPIEAVGPVVKLDGPGWSGELPAFSMTPPGDASAAAFLLAAASTVGGSSVSIRRVGVNPTRTGFLEILRDMRGTLAVEPRGEERGEPLADLHAAAADLVATRVGGELTGRAIDEIPVACVLMARASGVSEILDAAELRHKESDRIRVMSDVLRAFGVDTEERDDGLRIEGAAGRTLRAAQVDSQGDHRVAMSAAVLALAADGPSRVKDADCIATSFPRFVGTLRALGARIDVT